MHRTTSFPKRFQEFQAVNLIDPEKRPRENLPFPTPYRTSSCFRPPQCSVNTPNALEIIIPIQSTSERLIGVYGEFLDIRWLLELEQHAAFLRELFPPDHIYR